MKLPDHFFVLQYGSEPTSAFTSRILHVKAPLFFVCLLLYYAVGREWITWLHPVSSSHSPYALAIIKSALTCAGVQFRV